MRPFDYFAAHEAIEAIGLLLEDNARGVSRTRRGRPTISPAAPRFSTS